MNNVFDKQAYIELRREWTNGVTRVMAEKSLGQVCYNCGSSESIELHHIVPLRCGGTNNLSNIAVLCHRCHMAIHHGGNIHQYAKKADLSGRPHKVSDDELTKAFDDYSNCRIGTSECKERIKMSKSCKITDMVFYKNYLKERGIKSVKNNIDIIRNKRGDCAVGDETGYITYLNGKVEYKYYGIRDNG